MFRVKVLAYNGDSLLTPNPAPPIGRSHRRNDWKSHMVSTDSLESAIHRELTRVYVCTVDELSGLLSRFSRDQVLAMVERMTQEGAIAYRTSDTSRTLLWIPPIRLRKRNPADTMVQKISQRDHPSHDFITDDTVDSPAYTHNV